MVLLAVPAFTLTGFGCRFLTAYRLFYRRREEFVEFEQMVYDEDAFTDDADIKERLTIRNTAATMTAADILEEFGLIEKRYSMQFWLTEASPPSLQDVIKTLSCCIFFCSA
ncbi:MAG: hypothetical protein ACLTDX_20900 [[Clostridium] innocuum]